MLQAESVHLDGTGLAELMDRFQQDDVVEFPLLYHIYFERSPSADEQQRCFGDNLEIHETKDHGESRLVVCRSATPEPQT